MLDPNTSPEARRKLAEADDTPADILEELSRDSDRIVRSFIVAKNAHTSQESAAERDFTTRYEVAKNDYICQQQ